MGVRRRVYVVVGVVIVLVVVVTAYDQLAVEPGSNSTYVLGKATPAVIWLLTLVTPFALVDFFIWLRRSNGNSTRFWWATVAVAGGFVIGFLAARNWRLDWLVEGDIEISFDRDEFLEIVVGLWIACLVALIARVVIGSSAKTLRPSDTKPVQSDVQ